MGGLTILSVWARTRFGKGKLCMMKKPQIFVLVIFLLSLPAVYGQSILSKKVNPDLSSYSMSHIQDWRKQTKADLETMLGDLDAAQKESFIKVAERANSFSWPPLLATVYLEFQSTGNRTNYERLVDERRKVLCQLVLGELMEKRGRFLSQIANGLWLTLEESTWVSPAHIVSQRSGAGLPDPTDRYIDLVAARTAVDLSFLYFLMKDDLDTVSPHLARKIKKELSDRIIKPYIKDSYWWMSFDTDFINNWNIWINTNVLKTILLVEDDEQQLHAVLRKLLLSADRFIDSYPEDGAIDEGASYWSHAGGELGQLLLWLTSSSADRLSFTDQQKINNIGHYIQHTHIADNVFVNFADASYRQIASAAKIWTYGMLFDDPQMKSLAAQMYALDKASFNTSSLHTFFMYLPYIHELDTWRIGQEEKESVFYESLGLSVIRADTKGKGIAFAGMGGHNGVSHNHNDVGSFILYHDGVPVLIDVGVATYNKQTFSAARYSLWHTQSQWHNLPLINGVGQRDGKAFRATDVRYREDKGKAFYSLDIAKAYPESAKVHTWKRSFELDKRKQKINVVEDFELTQWLKPSELMFISQIRPTVQGGALIYALPDNRTMYLRFDGAKVRLKVEEKPTADERLRQQWGDYVYRSSVEIIGNSKKEKIAYTMEIK